MIYKTLIVDDEHDARERLRHLLKQINADCQLVAEAEDGFKALEMISTHKPDLVFLNVELPGVNGIEMLRNCAEDPFIICTTAHDRFAVNAFEANTVAYLIKPVTTEKLEAAFEKLKRISRIRIDVLRELLRDMRLSEDSMPLQRLPVRIGNHIKMVSLDSILWIEAESKYTCIVTKDSTHISNYSISEIQERLNQNHFLRIHRSHIINLNHIVEFLKISDSKYRVVFDVQTKRELFISNRLFIKVQDRLQIR